MNIGIVTSMSGIGGTENVSKRLSDLFSSRGNKVFLISGYGPLISGKKDNKSQWINISFYEKGLFGLLMATAKLSLFLRKNNLDILHCQMARPVISCWLAKIISFSKVKIIWHSRGLKANTYRYVCPLFSALRIRAIGNCLHEKDKLIRYGYNKNLVDYAYNPLPKTREIASKNNNSTTFTIGSLSRLSKDRNVEESILILSELVKNNIDTKLIIGGNGDEMQNLINLCRRLNIENRVIFMGKITKLEDFFKEIDVLVNTIILHGDNGAGIGNNIIEAGTFRIPVISYNSCGIPEVILDNHTGFCIENYKRDLFIKRLIILKENIKLRKEIGLNLNNHINQLCSPSKVYSDLINIFKK